MSARPNCNGTAPQGNSKKHSDADNPPWQFRDQRVPARLCHLLRDGAITATDLLLLFVVDSLVKPQGAEEGCGCYATNAYLGRAINNNPAYVSQRLSYLNDMGLVLIVQVGRQRYLEAEWSRTAEERSALVGTYGDKCRLAHASLIAGLNEGIGKPIPRVKENLKAQGIGKPIGESPPDEELNQKEENCAPTALPTGHSTCNGFQSLDKGRLYVVWDDGKKRYLDEHSDLLAKAENLDTVYDSESFALIDEGPKRYWIRVEETPPKSQPKTSEPKPPARRVKTKSESPYREGLLADSSLRQEDPNQKLAEKLYRAVASARKVMRRPSLVQWAGEIAQLVSELIDRDNMSAALARQSISDLIDEYAPHIGEAYWPEIYSARALRDKWVKLEDRVRHFHSERDNPDGKWNRLSEDEQW